MKASIWSMWLIRAACGGVIGFAAAGSHGQSAAEPGISATPGPAAGQSAVVCANPPCKSAMLGRKSAPPPPGPRPQTEAELERGRYSGLFGELAGLERAAQLAESSGHAEIAASYRSYFADKSGLTQEEAEIVEKIGAEYRQQGEALQAKRIQTILTVRRANPGVRMSRFNSPEIAAVEQEIADLLPNAKAKILAQIGPKSFTRLDSYTIHGSGLPDGSGASAISDQYQTQAQKFVTLP